MKVKADVHFAIVPEWLLDATVWRGTPKREQLVSDRSVRLYAVLARYADKSGRAWPSRRTIAGRLGCSIDSVDRCLGELDEVGAISVQNRPNAKGDHDTNVYTLHVTPKGVGAPVRLPLGMGAATGGRTGAAQNESHRNESPKGAADSAAPLVAYYVDHCKAQGVDPPRAIRNRIGAGIRQLLRDGKDPEDLRIALEVVAERRKSPSALPLVLMDVEAEKHVLGAGT